MYALILYNLLMPQLEKKQVEPVKKKKIYFFKKLCNVFTTTLIISDKNFC